MSRRLDRATGVGGALAIAQAVGAVVVAGTALAAALGGKAGVPGWLRIGLGALALLVAVAVLGLTLAEQRAEARTWERRVRRWREDLFGRRGAGGTRRAEGRYFTGRTHALRELVAWLEKRSGGLCVMTGDPGSGKSAVLGRLVALGDRRERRRLAMEAVPLDTVPPVGSIDVALLAKGLTMTDVVEAIAVMIGASASGPDELIDAVLARERPLVVMVDALDEASGEGEARRIAQRLLKSLAAAGRDVGVKVLVGTRRGPGGELLDALGADKLVIDLDTPTYLEKQDLVEYVRSRLLREGEPDAHTPYRTEPAVAARVALAVADRAAPSFLIAHLVSGALCRASRVVDTRQRGWETHVAADVGSAMDDYLDCFDEESDRRRARDLLTALAYAEGAGLPHGEDDDGLWPRLASALSGKRYHRGDVEWLLDTSAADLLERTSTDETPTYRLFHQALVNHLRPPERELESQRRYAKTLTAGVREPGTSRGGDWSVASPYVKRHLATHAARARRLDGLLEDAGYLLVAEPNRLLRALPAATSTDARQCARAYQHAVHHLRSRPQSEHAAYLEMTARQSGARRLAESIAQVAPARPWSVRWAHWRPASDHAVVGLHSTPVFAVAVAQIAGRPALISGGWGGRLQLRDLATAARIGPPLTGHEGPVWALTVADRERGPLAVSGGDDGMLMLWDLAADGRVAASLRGHDGPVLAVAAAEVASRAVAVSGGKDGTVRLWELDVRAPVGQTLSCHDDWVTAVAIAEIDGHAVLASGCDDGSLRMQDLSKGAPAFVAVRAHSGAVRALAIARLGSRAQVVSGGQDGTLCVWDPANGELVGALPRGHDGAVQAVTVAELDDGPVVISGGEDGTLRLWDLAECVSAGAPLRGHDGTVWAVALAELEDRPVVISGGEDGSVRLWDVAARDHVDAPLSGHDGPVRAVTLAELEDGPAVISGGEDGALRLWDMAAGGEVVRPLRGHDGPVRAVAVAELDGRPVVISGGQDGTLRLWDVLEHDSGGTPLRDRDGRGHDGPVLALAAAEREGRPVAISGGRDGTLRLWDLAAGGELDAALGDGLGAVWALAVAEVHGRHLAISGDQDGKLRLWDLAEYESVGDPLRGHDWAVLAIAVAHGAGGPLAISGSWDRTLVVWDLAEREAVGDPLHGHEARVWAVAVAEVARRPVVVSGSQDGTLRVWDLATRKIDKTIDIGSPVMDLAGSSGSCVAVATRSGHLLLDLCPELEKA